jgi:rhodanese-related sulfurtransferase
MGNEVTKKASRRPFVVCLLLGILVMISVVASGNGPGQVIESIIPEEAYYIIKDSKERCDFVILDIRTPDEYARQRIENAINIDYHSETFEKDLDKLDKEKTYIIYCRTGERTGNALNTFRDLGFREVYNMLWGIKAWIQEGLPTTN